jgi:hypothetical protein
VVAYSVGVLCLRWGGLGRIRETFAFNYFNTTIAHLNVSRR